MKTLKYTLFLICTLLALILSSLDVAAQSCAPPPPPGTGAAGGGGGGGGPSDCDDEDNDDDGDEDESDEDSDDTDWDVNVVRPSDPNDITGPAGFDSLRWVARNETMPYLVRFENSPIFATASAVRVEVICPIDEKHDILQFRLGSYGFNGMLFEVPPNTAIYSTQLNLIDEQGIYVDITAGVNIVTREAFWIFQSIDPLTGLPVTDVDKGFLPVKDTTFTFENDTLGIGIPGDGFANFTIKPSQLSQTRDTVIAFADIVFDDEEIITTNVEVHTIDALPPTSTIAPLPQTSPVENLQLIVNIEDDPEGSGVRDFDLYVSVNNNPYVLFATNIAENIVQFSGEPGSSYRFYTRARDNVNNLESKSQADVETTISTEPCELDCNGDPCGEAFYDDCGNCVGGNTGLDECSQDCYGEYGGTAYFDACGQCVGGNTGLDECVQDCNGDFGGTAFFDLCGQCVGGNTGTEECVADCNGDLNGTAYTDDCGICVEGNTGLLPCNTDCLGISGGTAILDDCGVCRLPGDPDFNSTCADCNGEPFGAAYPNSPCIINGNPGTFNSNCTCIPQEEPCVYFLSGNNANGGTDIFRVVLDEAALTATLYPIHSTAAQASIALNTDNGRLLLAFQSGNAYQTLNPFSTPVQIGALFTKSNSLGTVTGVAYGGSNVYFVSTTGPSAVWRIVQPPLSQSYYSFAQVSGGDVVVSPEGDVLLASASPRRLFKVLENGPNQIVAILPDQVSGIAAKGNAGYILLSDNSPELILGDANGSDTGIRYTMLLNGAPHTVTGGDLASGCISGLSAVIAEDINGEVVVDLSTLTSLPNPTEGMSTVIYQAASAGRALLEVYDIRGMRLATIFNLDVEAGQVVSSQFDGSALPNGVYLYRLTTDSEVRVEKFMIAR
jgi:hypothetical protein